MRISAVVALVLLGPVAFGGQKDDRLAKLCSQLLAPEASSRVAAATALGEFRPVYRGVVIRLMDRLADGDAAVRTAVQEALRSLAEASDFRGAATGLSRPPRPIKTERPSYPADALKGRIQGTVLVEFLVTMDGSVTRARVVESVVGLDEAALEAVKGFSFVPAVKDGRLVAAIARAPLVFRLP